MKKLLLSTCLIAMVLAGRAEVPSLGDLQAAVRTENLERLRTWVNQNGVDSSTSASALTVAAMEGNRPMLDQLLALGIPVSATNEYGASPLIKAAEGGITEMVRHLLERGARVDGVGRCFDPACKGHTALMGAVCKQDLEMVKMLLAAGANPHVADDAALKSADQLNDVPLFLTLQQFGARENPTTPPPHKRRRQPFLSRNSA
jgi:ankyrin repeat protein